MQQNPDRYLSGPWESIWTSEPNVKLRVVFDSLTRTVLAAQRRTGGSWFALQASEFEYLVELIGEHWADVYDDPVAYGLTFGSVPPDWGFIR
jgi:hypothetical protein